MTALSSAARVLVRAPSWLGDFVAAEPVLRALHARAGPGRSLTVVAPAPFLDLVRARLGGARFVPLARGAIPDPRVWRGHDAALLLDGSWRSAWCAFRAGIPARIGWAGGGRAPLLSFAPRPALERGATPLGLGVHGRWPRRLPRPFAASCVELATLAGLDVRERAPRLGADPAEVERARERLRRAGVDPAEPFALVNAGGRPGSAKAPEPAALARFARATGLPVVIVGAPGEADVARATRSLLADARCVLLDDPLPALPELVALLSLASACISADSGPRHLAQALGVAVTVLFGPTDPRHTSQHGPNVRSVRADLACSPCHRERCRLEGASHRACMREIAR